MIKSGGLDKITSYIDSELAISADYTIGGSTHAATLRRSILDGTTVRKQIYLTQNDPYGTVDSARLYDKDGEVFAERTDKPVHESGKGLLIEFKFDIREV